MKERFRKKFEEQLAISESMILCLTLAIVGGFLDAYTYISRGQVFANAQTGNIVLLGIGIAKGEPMAAVHYLLPILAFAVGIVVSEYLKSINSDNLHWRQLVIGIEFVIIAIVGFLSPDNLDYIANVAISFVCALQVQAFRRIHGTPFATTMCTGNLRTGMEFFCVYLKTHDPSKLRKTLQYFLVIAFFALGAFLGAHLTWRWDAHAIFFCNILLAVVFLLLFEEKRFYKEDVIKKTPPQYGGV